MTRSLIQKVSFISLVLLLSGILIFSLTRRTVTVAPVRDKKGISSPLSMKGISFKTSDHERILSKIEADELKVNPRRFYFFNVKSVNEVSVTNAKIELYLYEDKTVPSGMDIISATEIIMPYKKGESASKELGRITRGVIYGLNIAVYKGGKLSMSVKTARGAIDFKKKTLVMRDVHLEDLLSGKVVESKSVIWDNDKMVFEIPGEYTAVAPKGRTTGHGLKIALKDSSLHPK